MALKIFELMATVGLDDSAYRNAIQDVQSSTKKAVASLSAEYNKAAKSVAELTRKYNESVAKTGKTSQETKELKTQLAAAQAQLRATTSALKSANTNMAEFASSTQKASGESLTGALTKANLLTGALSKLGSVALSAAKSFAQSGIDYNAQIESYTVGFTNMLGSAEAAQQAMAAIQEDAAKTPFNVEALTQANQLLISAGENAGYSEKVIMALGDAVSATGGGNAELSRMAANLQQIANVGKASAIDIKQFAYAGINIYQVLADYTGKSVQEVQQMTISYDTLSQALIAASEEGGRYYGAMDTQSQTMNGRISTLKDNVSQLAGVLSENFAVTVGDLITRANTLSVAMKEGFQSDGITGMMKAASDAEPKLSNLSDAVEFCSKHSEELKAVLGAVAGAVLTYKTVTVGASIAQLALNAAMSANPIGIVITLLGGLTGALVTAYNTNSDFKTGVDDLANSMRNVKNQIVGATNALLGYKAATVDSDGFGGSSGGEFYETLPSSKITDEERNRRKQLHEKRVQKSQLEHLVSSITGGGTGTTGKNTTPKAVAADTKKLADTITETATEIVAGTGNMVGSIQRVTETAANTYNVYDGTTKELKGTTKETVKTITDSWVEVVDGTEKTIKRVTKEVTDADNKVTKTVSQTCNNVVLSVTEMQNRIDKNLSNAQSKWSNGVFGTLQNLLTNAASGNWSGIATNIAKLIWGEVSQDQRDIISKWADDALGVINEKYSSGGLSAVKETLHQLFTDGIAQDANEAGTAVQSFSKILSGLGESGGMGTKLAGIVTNFSGMAEGVTGALGGIVSFIASNPVVAAILGITALVGGVALSSMAKNKDDSVTNNYESPFSKTPVYDSLAEFSYRADQLSRYHGYAEPSFTSDSGKQQTDILQRISDTLDQHLPAIGTGQLIIDANGVQALAGAMQPTITNGTDGDLGIRAARKARGN